MKLALYCCTNTIITIECLTQNSIEMVLTVAGDSTLGIKYSTIVQ